MRHPMTLNSNAVWSYCKWLLLFAVTAKCDCAKCDHFKISIQQQRLFTPDETRSIKAARRHPLINSMGPEKLARILQITTVC